MARFLRYCIIGLVSFSPVVFSADRVVVVEPSQLQKTYTPGTGPYAFKDSRSWSEPVSVQNGRLNVPVVSDRKFTWPSFRAGLKNALKLNPASIALNATVAGALGAVGWLLDPANNSIQKTEFTPSTYTPTGTDYFWAGIQTPSSNRRSTAQAACAALLSNPNTNTISVAPFPNKTDWRYCSYYVGAGGPYTDIIIARWGSACPSGMTLSLNGESCGSTAPKLIGDADIDSVVSSINDPVDAADIAPDVITAVPGSYDYPDGFDFSGPESISGEPVTTTSTSATGSTTVTESVPNYSFDYSTNPNTITTTTTTTTNVYQDGNLTLTTNTTNAGTVNPVEPVKPLEIPTDCEFMPTVCAWLDWFKSPAPPPNDPALPEITDSFEKSYSGPSLSATCPPPFTVNTGAFGSILMPVQPLCDLAGLIKYLVLSAAGLLAAFIISGTRRA